ncbi:VOC family protein [Pseudoflavitalea rhizosphaerae]|uniref:VOC family protein n=1 Tax=Pseudoflavitalea rhizosphaerae TaxID=1884793 RepID=UPI000F8F445D|nr:VOC family protein [Pseudoflavitalea rhizosphaerae]
MQKLNSQKLTTMLCFNGRADEAVKFYKDLFPGTTVGNELRAGDNGPAPKGTLITASFNIFGQDFVALNFGPQGQFNDSVSFVIPAETQEDIDKYWNALTSDGGQESMCGWCKDKFGLSWQVTPPRLIELITHKDPAKAGAAMQAMMKMKKIVLADLEAAVSAA